MDKDRVAEILNQIGILLELKGENPFKTRAYANAARALESLAEPLEKLVAEQSPKPERARDTLTAETVERNGIKKGAENPAAPHHT